jgi:hypothetical protein
LGIFFKLPLFYKNNKKTKNLLEISKTILPTSNKPSQYNK